MANKKTTSWFIQRAVQVHGNVYDYSKSVYLGNNEPIAIICKQHGEFTTTPNKHLSFKVGCLQCSGYQRVTNITVDRKLINTSVKRIGNVINTNTPVLFKCLDCETEWETKPSSMFGKEDRIKTGCPICNNKRRSLQRRISNEDIDNRIQNLELNLKRQEDVRGMNTKIRWECVECGNEWQASPSKVVYSETGCPRCNKRRFSKMAVRWLNSLSEKHNVFIQHHLNGGEYLIPGTKYHVDGYCKETNTVYEFYGDFYHGNPTRFKPNVCCHPYNKGITAGELFQKTLERERVIKDKGFNIISIWESDYISKF